MKYLLATAAAVATLTGLAAAAPASAQSEVTGSIGWSRTDTGDANLDAVTGRIRWTSGYFGVEGEVSGGVGSDDVTVGGTTFKAKLRDQAAIYGVGKVPMGANADLFARVGYGTSKFSGSAFGGTVTGSEESWNYGVGGEYYFDGKNGVRADYTRENFKNSVGDADVWSLSYTRRF
jgi:hypothetical protein